MNPIASIRLLVRVVTVAIVVSSLGGCNYLGPAAYFTFGQPKTPAAYTLIDQTTLVFVDDRSSAIPRNATQLRRTMADQASVDLQKKELISDMINSADAMALARQHDRNGELLSIQELGEATGAAQVIYVEVTSFRGSPDGIQPRPTATFRLKVLDIQNKVRLFPLPGNGAAWHEVKVLSPTLSPEQYRTSTGRRQIEKMLALLAGEQIAKVFYKHVEDEIGSRLTRQ